MKSLKFLGPVASNLSMMCVVFQGPNNFPARNGAPIYVTKLYKNSRARGLPSHGSEVTASFSYIIIRVDKME